MGHSRESTLQPQPGKPMWYKPAYFFSFFAIVTQTFQEFFILIRQRSGCKQVVPMLKRAHERLFPPPLYDFAVVSGKQHFGHAMAAEFWRTSVMRVFKQSRGVGVICGSVRVAQHTGKQP